MLADADVVVAGGGPAGLGAALAAARLGARVVLCERYGFLGGNFTVASVGTICGLYLDTGDGFDFVVGGIAREFADALAARRWRGSARSRSRRPRSSSTCRGRRSGSPTTW